MLLLKELPTAKSLQKVARRYPDADVQAIADFTRLLRAATDISSALDGLLAKHGLLQGRWWVLVLLARQDDHASSPSDLADKAGVTKATMTGFIDGLEREGLVTRMMNSTDRRKFLISLTAAGQAKLDAVMPNYYTSIHALMNVLNSTQRQVTLESVELLAAHLEVMK